VRCLAFLIFAAAAPLDDASAAAASAAAAAADAAAAFVAGPLETSCADDSGMSMLQRASLGSVAKRSSANDVARKEVSGTGVGKKRCVVIVSASDGALERMRTNARHVESECDFIFGHYDFNQSAYEVEEWYGDLVVLAKEQKFMNKIDLVRDLVQNDMALLKSYEMALLIDDDMDLTKLDTPCFVEWFAASPYIAASPNAPDTEEYAEWDPSSCPVRVMDALTPTAFALKTTHLAKFANMVLPETLGPDGRIECDFGTILTMCRWLSDQPSFVPGISNACAFVDKCGSALHDHVKSKRSEEYMQICARNTMAYVTKRPAYMMTQLQKCDW